MKVSCFSGSYFLKVVKGFMPPKGEPLTYSEIKLLQWWIDAGASFEEKLTASPLPGEMKALLLRDFQVDVARKPLYERMQVEPVAEATLEKLSEAGFKTASLSSESPFLEVKVAAGLYDA